MALTYGFYNSVEGDRKYDAIQMGQIFDGIITDGVYATFLKAMVVKASENASEVIVQPGRCWFNHTWTYIDADYPVEAPAPEVILDRVDALVLDINQEYSDRANSIIWVQGTPSSLNPERPTLIKSVTHNQYPLAYVYRKAGTTMIYAADITNAVGTSETPFVTGVLQGINIDDLLAQWDDEFHTWEAATKTSFEAWMVNQQSVYVTWFDSIKDQMEGDLTDFEAWFETIRGIIDEEAATHLQAEIDALSEMLPAGSHIDVSTTESTLFNRNVTVSDGVHSKTVQFDASGAATVESFPYIGIISVTSTDGTRTAEESINIPYFGRYSAVLAFWSATVNLVGDESLAALPVTVRDSNGDVVSVVTLNASGQGVFTATKPDTYKFIYTYGGQTMEVSLAVTQETTYEVEIHGGFNYQAWLTAGRVSETFESLDEVLADEPTLRQLFLVHDSVDYICNTFSESATSALADITKIFNTDLAAKWINLSDYALDHFYAVEGIKSIMDTADKYGYGEWTLMPQVPTMTSNTAPYCTITASGQYSSAGTTYSAYRAFDADASTTWNDTNSCSNGQSATGWIKVQFPSAVCITKIYEDFGDVQTEGTVVFEGSNDDSTYTPLSVSELSNGYRSVENTNKYTFYKLTTTQTYTGSSTNVLPTYKVLQFYAWAPKGNVPVMTSNTAPYGEASASSVITSNSPAWEAFDGIIGTESVWCASDSDKTNAWIQYKFTNPVCAKRFMYSFGSVNRYANSIVIKASNTGAFSGEETTLKTFTPQKVLFVPQYEDVTNNDFYLYYRVIVPTVEGSYAVSFSALQFYGRELKVSVPAMTSNTAPYGEVSASSYNDSNAVPWKAFGSTGWRSTSADPLPWIQYKFTNSMVVKKIAFKNDSSAFRQGQFKLQSSDDGVSFTDLITFNNTTNNVLEYTDVPNSNSSKYLRVETITKNMTNNTTQITTLQFYGLDYSEKEFEVGTTKKWLYDHGVELETLTPYTTGTASINKKANVLNLVAPASDTRACLNYSVDFTNYDLERCKIENLSGQLILGVGSGFTGASIANVSAIDTIISKDLVIDVSSINTTYYADVYANYNTKAANVEISEWWLE